MKKIYIKSTSIDKPITTKLYGVISEMSYTSRGARIILTNIKNIKNNNLKSVRINISPSHIKNVNIGDEIKILAKLLPPPKKLLPYGYDFAFYAYFNEINAVGYALSPLEIIKSKPSNNYIQRLRTIIYNKLINQLGHINGNFAAALFIGNNTSINQDLMKDMRHAGISHILCVSGLHLSLVILICFSVFRFCFNLSDFLAYNINIKIISGICSLVIGYVYLILSGNHIPASRAFIMVSIFMISNILGRRYHAIRAIKFAAIVILSLNPHHIFHPSFQLSFTAVISLIASYEFYDKYKYLFLSSNKNLLYKTKNFLISTIYSSAIVSIAISPIVIYHFHIFSVYSVLANLLVIPIMSFMLMPLVLVSLLLMIMNMEYISLPALNYIINTIKSISIFTNSLPSPVIYIGYINDISLIIYFIGFFWIVLWESRIRLFGSIIIVFSIIMMVLVKKPDFIFDTRQKIVGVKNECGKLEIYGKRSTSKFIQEYWSSWFGQREILMHYDYSMYYKLMFNDKINHKDLNKKDIILVFCNINKCKNYGYTFSQY